MLASVAKVRVRISILQAFPLENIYYTVKSSMPRDDLCFHPEMNRTVHLLSIIHQPRQTYIRTIHL